MTRSPLIAPMAAALLIAAACGGSDRLVSTETVTEATSAADDRIEDLRDDDDELTEEDGRCAVRAEAQPIAAAVASEAGLEITRAESFASGYESERGDITLYYCDWTRNDEDLSGPEGIEGVGLSFGPYDGEPSDYSPQVWEFAEEESDVASSEVLDPIDDGTVVYTCIDYEESDDTCVLDWIRDGLAISIYAYGDGVTDIDPQPLVEALTAALPELVEAIAAI